MTPEQRAALIEVADKAGQECFCQVCEVRREVGRILGVVSVSDPEWRIRVNAYREVVDPQDNPVETVLFALGQIAGSDNGFTLRDNLAGVVAVCEVTVGGRWQADPDQARWFGMPVAITSLLVGLTAQQPDWQRIGNRAAFWLREVC